MERTQIYMTEEQKKILSVLSEKTGESQSVLIRKALDEFIARESKDRIEKQKDFWSAHAGSWGDDDGDSEDFINTLRAGADSRLNGLYGALSESTQGGFVQGRPKAGDPVKGSSKGKGKK